MHTHAFIRLFAGFMILLSVALVYFVSPWWLLFTGFIGVNLFQSALTGFCPPTYFLQKLGWVDEQGKIHWGRRR